MTLANRITIARIILIPVFMAVLLSKASLEYFKVSPQWGAIIAGLIFIFAALTDTVDGYLARSRNEVTVVGQILDPLADKLLVSAALISLVGLGRISAWIAVLIIAREFAVTGLRMAAAAKHIIIPASVWGKAKTISQIVAVSALIFNLSFTGASYLEWFLVAVAVILTIVSGIDYFAKGVDVFSEEVSAS
ncbi:MAG: CDP-diacylglycerol--glycerol-3-phosphate 3-phosphatidyltransferase [Actinomycetota bacterium]